MKRIQVLAGVDARARRLEAQTKKILARSFTLVEDKPDLIVVVGGDGALLHHLRRLRFPATPVLGVDGGSLGYFQEISAKALPELPKILKSKEYSLQKLPLLQLKINDKISGYAFNEFAIERASARAAHLSISLNGHKFERFIGDGLILATPQGSTAYSGAAGGAVLPYGLKIFELVPSNPHQSALYKAMRQPLVLGSDTIVHIDVLDPTNRPVRVVADGQTCPADNSFDVGLSSKSITMLRTEKFNFFERLSQKLVG